MCVRVRLQCVLDFESMVTCIGGYGWHSVVVGLMRLYTDPCMSNGKHGFAAPLLAANQSSVSCRYSFGIEGGGEADSDDDGCINYTHVACRSSERNLTRTSEIQRFMEITNSIMLKTADLSRMEFIKAAIKLGKAQRGSMKLNKLK